jgi:membrane fusion protein, multidrug efflux system
VRKSLFIAAGFAGGVLLGVGIGAKVWHREAQPKPAQTPVGAKPSAAGLRVTAVRVAPQSISEKISATGTLRADEAIDLQPETNGKIVMISFHEGSLVRRGDLLVKMNDADLKAQLTRAVYRRDLAELKERRLAKLMENVSIRQDEYDAAVNDLNVQRAEVALAEAMIAKTEMRAPFDGVIGLRFVSEGAFVNATTRIATLQRIDRVKLDFSIPEKYASRIRLGSTIAFSTASAEKKFTGQVYAMDPRVDSATRTVLVRASSENAEGQLYPGAFAKIELTLAEISDAIMIPSAAVVPGVSEKFVFVAVDGKAVRRSVWVGTRTETSVQILEGLKAGELVITSGVQQLRGGLPVTVFDQSSSAKKPGDNAASTAAETKPSGSGALETVGPVLAQEGNKPHGPR